jgi:hypothetical protein
VWVGREWLKVQVLRSLIVAENDLVFFYHFKGDVKE